MSNKYTEWYTSWIKWSGDLWGRLEKAKSKLCGFYNLLWDKCAYCNKYLVGRNDCICCALNKLDICYICNLHKGNFTIAKLYKAWGNKDRQAFNKQHKIILQALKDTRFVD